MLSSNKLRFIGGGRWAQIVLAEILKLNPKIDIDWVTNHSLISQNSIKDFLRFEKNIKIFKSDDFHKLNNPSKVIIASNSINHCRDLLVHKYSVETLIEKPLFPDLKSFLCLTEIEKKCIFFNLEFYNAFFIIDFCAQINLQKIITLEVEWHDPFVELRPNGETKYSEVFSSIFMDQLLHVMSILKVMKIDSSKLKNIDINLKKKNSNGEIIIISESNNFQLRISLSRFSSKRIRKITVNNGQISLDFSSKPILNKNGNFIQEFHSKNRLFPIAKTLEGFLIPSNKSSIKNLSLKSLEPEIQFCFNCESLYTKIYKSRFPVLINKFDPFLAYFAGIHYYQKYSNQKKIKSNFYLKGDQGLAELEKWWENYKIQFN